MINLIDLKCLLNALEELIILLYYSQIFTSVIQVSVLLSGSYIVSYTVF
jgi:hypothetical protein